MKGVLADDAVVVVGRFFDCIKVSRAGIASDGLRGETLVRSHDSKPVVGCPSWTNPGDNYSLPLLGNLVDDPVLIAIYTRA
jgi:hypothetical protein